MKKINLLLAVFAISMSAFAQNTWTLDKTHYNLRFSISHLMVSDVEGSFKKNEGKIVSSKDDFSDAKIDFTVDVNSIDTDNEDRDKHLKSPDYFDAEKYPTITFKSTSFKKVSGKNYKLTGDLTMHGVTKPITFDVVYNGTAVHPYTKATLAGFKITGVLKRTDFNIGNSTPAAVLGEDVTISTNAEFIKG